MAEFSNYYEDKIIDHMLRNQSFTPPSTLYVALFTASTGLETNNPTAEVSGGSYARQPFTLTVPSDGVSSNAADITFPTATANWGDISHVAIMDALTGGNVLMWSPANTTRTVLTGDTYRISAGNLTVQVD